MKPRRRDVIGAGVLFVVLVGMVALLVLARPADPAGDAGRLTRPQHGREAASMLKATGRDRSTGHGGSQPCRPLDRATMGRSPWSIALFLVLLVVSIALGSPAVR